MRSHIHHMKFCFHEIYVQFHRRKYNYHQMECQIYLRRFTVYWDKNHINCSDSVLLRSKQVYCHWFNFHDINLQSYIEVQIFELFLIASGTLFFFLNSNFQANKFAFMLANGLSLTSLKKYINNPIINKTIWAKIKTVVF